MAITAVDLAKAKPTVGNGSYSGGTNLPGAFGQHYAPAASPSSGGGGGGSGSGGGGGSTASGDSGVSAAASNPYDPQQQAFINTLGGAIQNIQQSGNEAFSSAGRGLSGSADALYNKVSTGQKSINTSRENNELNRINGIQDIVNFVRQGLQSGATRLANANALESSAAPALARAYGQIGNSKVRNVNNQAFLQNRNIDTQQQNLDLQRAQGLIDWHRQRDEVVSNIASQVRQQLAQLDQQGASLSLPGRVAVDQQKQAIIDSGQATINQIDQALQNRINTVQAESPDAVRAAAAKLRTAGYNTGSSFDTGLANIGVTSTNNGGSGPPLSQLPLFVSPNTKKDQSTA